MARRQSMRRRNVGAGHIRTAREEEKKHTLLQLACKRTDCWFHWPPANYTPASQASRVPRRK
eukprot:scaffold95315_cov37-Tisochrysis_lutea.AAC.1